MPTTPHNSAPERMPGPHEQVLVRCAAFQCLAYRNAQGEWRSVFGDHRIPEVLEVVSTPNGATAPPSASRRIDALLARIDLLPPAPRVLPRLLSALSDTQTNISEIADLVALDTVLTARLLRICNSAYFGMPQPVEEVSEAVHRLGYETVYRMVAVLSASDCFKVRDLSEADADRLWRHSVTAGFAALFVAEDVGLDGGALFTAGILHDLGKVFLAAARTELCAALGAGAPGTEIEALEGEMLTYGSTHAEVGGRMLERWHFSDHLAASVRCHHSPAAAGDAARFAACVALANALAHQVNEPATQPTAAPEAEAALNILGLAGEQMESYNGRIRENLLFAELMCRG
jgi:putative nucleotidyltransferase with HDIG domain